jgi:hypothetical protein
MMIDDDSVNLRKILSKKTDWEFMLILRVMFRTIVQGVNKKPRSFSGLSLSIPNFHVRLFHILDISLLAAPAAASAGSQHQ